MQPITNIDIVTIQPLLALVFGILILMLPKILNYLIGLLFDPHRLCGPVAAFLHAAPLLALSGAAIPWTTLSAAPARIR